MCFTWTKRINELRLSCTVNNLIFDVAILNNNGKELASCTTPSNCVSYVTNGRISQDIATNTTILAVPKSSIDSSLNGNFTCRHGRGCEQSTAEINVDFGANTNDNQKYSLWTIIGLIPTLLLINTLMIIKSSGCCCKKNDNKLAQNRPTKCNKIFGYWFLLFIVMVLDSALPLYLDYFEKSVPCSAEYFIADGVILGIVCHVMSNLYGINNKTLMKGSESDTSYERKHDELKNQDQNYVEKNESEYDELKKQDQNNVAHVEYTERDRLLHNNLDNFHYPKATVI